MRCNTPVGFLLLITFGLRFVVGLDLPDKVYGVNLGSWLLIEPWMLPQEWLDMGGQDCSDCSQCIRSEYAFAQAYPDTVDEIFAEHWATWFTQDDVDKLVDAGINTVRIPLGYWIVESLVDRSSEFYPKGGMKFLKQGLKMLKGAGIAVILDHHGLPGVQSADQMFAGRCTKDVQFFNDYNYRRALVWTAVMTALSHFDPDFSTVVGIQAVNEPTANAALTPGYGEFQHNFVEVVRTVEVALGIPLSPQQRRSGLPTRRSMLQNLRKAESQILVQRGFAQIMNDAMDIVDGGMSGLSDGLLDSGLSDRQPLFTTFMDILWQHNSPANPADVQDGPQFYDNHIYYSFGGIADANEEAYLQSMCNLNRIEQNAAQGNSPIVFGEWALSTNFQASDDFLRNWADAQKIQYSEARGWIFWNFKIEHSKLAGDTSRQWSYLDGVRNGYLPKDPATYNNPHVCDRFWR